MSIADNKSDKDVLRKKAEELLKKRKLKISLDHTKADWLKAIHELDVYKIELEMQSEELRLPVIAAQEALRLSEENFRLIFENNSAAIAIIEPDTTISMVNDAYCKLGGFKKEEVIGTSWTRQIPPEDLGRLKEYNRMRLLNPKDAPNKYEFTFYNKNGEIRNALMSISLSEHRKIIASFIDITDRKLAEKKLYESELNYRLLIETSDQGILVERGTNFRFVNSKMTEITGYTDTELLTLPIMDIVHNEDRELAKGNYTKRINGEDVDKKYCFRIIHKDGSVKWIEISGAKSEWEGQPAVINFVTDITARKLSEEELQLQSEILENMEEGVLLIRAADAVILYANPVIESLFGYKQGKLIGMSITSLYSFTEKSPEEIIKTLNAARKWNGEVQMKKKDGTLCWGHANVLTFNHPKFGPVWISIYTDITELREAERSMVISEEKYRTTLNASPDGILLTDMNGLITEVSEIGLELFGTHTKNDLVGKAFSQFIAPEDEKAMHELFEKTMNEGLFQNAGLKIKKISKTSFLSETSATLIQGPTGEPLSFMVVIRDISHRQKMETNQMHADRMANLGEMASGIAHEINQPLNIISMVLDKILFESDKTETIDKGFLKNKADKIFENITRIRNIIDHIRAFSMSQNDYVLSLFNVNASIENAVSLIVEQFKHLGIRLNLHLDKKIPQIIGNTFKFEQVIVNLLNNAKDAVIEKKNKQEEYCDLIVAIRSFRENETLIVEITDNGIGISNDDINNIILPFYTTKEEGKGTGLGLSICYQIIKEMGGNIDITSDKVYVTKIKLVLKIQKKN